MRAVIYYNLITFIQDVVDVTASKKEDNNFACLASISVVLLDTMPIEQR